jgi:hypothetical protein
LVRQFRWRRITPHVAQNNTSRRSAIDHRTTRHPGYGLSQQKRKRVIVNWVQLRPPTYTVFVSH